MAIQAPTRITIEIHPPQADGRETDGAPAPTIRIIPEPGHVEAQPVMVAEPRDRIEPPAAYDPGPCTCLDAEDCGADHEND